MQHYSSIIELVQEKSRLLPDTRAYTFLAYNGEESQRLNYREIENQACAIASRIQHIYSESDPIESEHPPRVLLVYPPGLDFITAFYACLFSGAIAVPVSPPDPLRLERTLPRFLSTIKDSGASMILTTTDKHADILHLLQADSQQSKSSAQQEQLNSLRESIHNKHIHTLKTDAIELEHASTWQAPTIKADNIAFLQYTSGSTASPKGVMISHVNILHNLEIIHTVAMQDSDSCFVSWLPNYHDMGLIGSILYPMYVGFHSVQMSSTSFLKRPVSWLKALTKYHGTITAAPNFAYELCVTRIPLAKREGLDLSSVNLALSGSEPVRLKGLKTFFDAFSAYGLRWESLLPSYGLAEATCAVSGDQLLTPLLTQSFDKKALASNHVLALDNTVATAGLQLVSSGAPLASLKLIIVNPDSLQICPANEVGEIWLEGDCVGAGYWNNTQETEQTFGACLKENDGHSYLRTGDLGFIYAGNLFVSARLKDLIVLNGYNHYPQDIEISVEASHPKIRPTGTAAFTVDQGSTTELIIVAEIDRRAADLVDAMKAAIVASLSLEHSLVAQHIVFIQAGSLYKTSSGKIQRNACRQHFLNNTLKTI